ncbi:c-type cytochrome [Piscinibacter sp. XHJ-5]|uniref:c-type cytochrome n=1 Tax=Piscinibacter sp. XHJ-5 TaxID=3037797 RepID=UPI002452C1D0|nr:c-type cytochrome [Piscinibacter sp. XHJ-5]
MRTLLAPALVFITLVAGTCGAFAEDVKANALAGEKKAAMCIGCHSIPGYQASFPEVHKVPMLAGQNAKYMQGALAAYKSGDRKHPTMKAIAASLSDQDMADLAAYYESLPKTKVTVEAKPSVQPSREVAALLQRGNCASCHGENFSKPTDPSFPKLAGQHSDYLYVALKAYQVQRNAQVGRANPVMSGMAAGFKPHELKQLAEYIGSLPGEMQVVPQPRFR